MCNYQSVLFYDTAVEFSICLVFSGFHPASFLCYIEKLEWLYAGLLHATVELKNDKNV